MNIDRILKWVWLGCGALLLVLLLAGAAALLGVDRWFNSSREEAGVAIANQQETDQEEMKLSLTYQNPAQVGKSDFYLLPVYIAYEQSRRLKAGLGSSSYEEDRNVNQPSNIIFLDSAFGIIRTLLNKKALITNLRYPNQEYYNELQMKEKEQMDYILYQIAFNDTDKNGQIDSNDDADLFVSALDGSNLNQITRNWNVMSFDFYDDYKSILIRYAEKTDRSKNPVIKFAVYQPATQELKELTPIGEALKSIEQVLIQ